MRAFEALIQDCENDIRAGLVQNVSKRLASLNTAQVPREARLPLANLCRRAGLYSLGLALLGRIMRPQRTGEQVRPTGAEQAEYSALLLRSGAVDEALGRLRTVDAKAVPEAGLFTAFAHFSRWEFEAAVPALESYLAAPITPYQKLVGRVNLAYALLSVGRLEEANSLLESLIAAAREGGHTRLQSNAHALRAQVRLQSRESAAARADLEEAHGLLGSAKTVDRFVIVRWSLILEALETASMEPLNRLREQARALDDWDALRSADLYGLKIKYEKVMFLHLMFGTPFPAYRARVIAETGHAPEQAIYVLGPKNSRRLDLRTGLIDEKPALNPGRRPHQLIEILLRDFYRPLRVGGIFSELFPGEYFDIASSPDRVHQLMRRTRRWLEAEKIPVSIRESGGFYRLELTGPFSFRVPYERKPVDLMSLHFGKLAGHFQEGQTFTAKAAREHLSLSKATVHRLIDWAVNEGRISRQGTNARKATYQITPQIKKAA